jgi:asparagine synthase (glutamine-hydrolysing)
MCGITGWVAFGGDISRQQDTIGAMTATMACRGPDAEGTWLDTHAALGHRRLAVIDIEGGTQPMQVTAESGSAVMVYSGETYNYTELRRELRDHGHRFRTESDTEVVLRGYLQWGENVADRLNGMYAMAIWDIRARKLVMIRDRMGIKPFYYYPTPDGVLFGSEPKAILAHPDAERAVDADGLRELFVLAKTPGHATWAGMREVVPGTVVTLDRSGLREQVYWKLETRPHSDGRDETVARVRELLNDIVRRQLVADVPRCVLLSGGLDSSALTALAADELGEYGEKVRSFAVDFVGQEENFTSDDFRPTPGAPFVRDVAQHVGSDHTDIVLDVAALADPAVRRAVITARDIPLGLGDNANAFPWAAAMGRRGATGPGVMPQDMLEPGLEARLDLPGYLRDRYAQAVAEVEPADEEDEHEHRMRVMCYVHLTRFLRMLLDRKDRMSMAVGLEVRVPFCDHRLVEYVYNAPWSLKTYDGREKSLLRGAVADVLPRSVVQRVKSPYPQTQDAQYPAALQRLAREWLAQPGHPVFQLVRRDWLDTAAAADPQTIGFALRNGLERTLDLAMWLDMYQPELRL